jgi:nucleoside-diphosphate-sugar epimerase
VRVVGDLGPTTEWRRALEGVSAVVHAAGPAHTKVSTEDARRAIVEGSAALAAQAAQAGVKRFVYIGSIRACVDHTAHGAVDEDAPAAPLDIYGRAKREAEQAILAEAALQSAVLRPPLVIGPQPKANLAQFMRLLDTPLPLPIAGIRNKRNIVSLGSLAEAVRLLLGKPQASGVFHIADQPAVSTSEMAVLLRRGMGRPGRLISMPGIELVAPTPLVRSLEINDKRLREMVGYRGHDAREVLVGCGVAWVRR